MAGVLCVIQSVWGVPSRSVRSSVRLKLNGSFGKIVRTASTKRVNSFEQCVDLVRKHDYENYLCTLLLPNHIRNAAFVIRAFNVEIAQVRDMVSKADIGYMRVQFWKDAIERTFAGNPPMQPTTIELSKILEKHNLSKTWFLNLIKSREGGIADKGILTLEELESYCEKSVSSVYYLILQASGMNDIQCDHAASHLGKSQGISNMIRSIPFNASRGRPCLPLQIMSKYKISQEQLRRKPLKGSFQDAVLEVSTLANHHLKLSRELRSKLPSQANPILLPAVSVSSFLKSLEKTDFDIFHPKHQRRNYRLPFSLLLHKVRNVY